MMRLIALLLVLAPATAFAQEVSPILYLNRCSGGCTINGGPDDARTMSSSIPCAGTVNCGGGGCSCSGTSAGTYTIEEFEDWQGNTCALADAEWNMIVQCVKEVYSPFNIMVTDQKPAMVISHTQGIIAGRPANIGYGGAGIGGIASGALGCGPQDNVISFSFANIFGAGTQRGRVIELCAVAAQETAHSFGLDHSFEFSDGRSACTDPMTYRTDCGGQKFFRNFQARCGEFGVRPCDCGGLQNSHQRLLNIFGPGTPLTAPPTLTVSAPMNGDTVGTGATVVATSAAQRGVARLELWLNGYLWVTVKGAPFNQSGQPETTYPLTFPANVPNSIIDIVVKSFDDIEAVTVAPTITVTKGAPCTSADTCLLGQKCDAGKCYWDPPTGELGDACEYPQFCIGGNCLDTSEGKFCSQTCVVGVADSCPAGFECEGAAGGAGVCVTAGAGDDTCCGIGADSRTSSLLALFVVTLVLRRKRRR